MSCNEQEVLNIPQQDFSKYIRQNIKEIEIVSDKEKIEFEDISVIIKIE